jgi:hypothetical protein
MALGDIPLVLLAARSLAGAQTGAIDAISPAYLTNGNCNDKEPVERQLVGDS